MRACRPGRNHGEQAGRCTLPACSTDSIYSELSTISIVPTLHRWHSAQINNPCSPWLPQGRCHFGGTSPAPENTPVSFPRSDPTSLTILPWSSIPAGASTVSSSCTTHDATPCNETLNDWPPRQCRRTSTQAASSCTALRRQPQLHQQGGTTQHPVHAGRQTERPSSGGCT